jgi:ankyrin repeat protein
MSRAAVIGVAVSLLLTACSVESKDQSRCAVLQPPIQSAQLLNAIGDGKMPLLVECGLSANQAIPIEGQTVTPLQLVAGSGKPELVRQVVRAGADPNFAGTEEVALPPLEVALMAKKYEAATTLLELGAHADYQLAHSRTNALMTIAVDTAPGNLAGKMGKALVGKGAAINGIDDRGNTPLHWSARFGNTNYAQTLLQLGADACLKNAKGQRAADVAPAGLPSLRDTLAAACKS